MKRPSWFFQRRMNAEILKILAEDDFVPLEHVKKELGL